MRDKPFLISIFLVLFFHTGFSFGQDTDHWETVFYSNSEFKYLSSSTAPPDSEWRTLSFDDSSWDSGSGGIGFADGDDGTIISFCVSVSIRKSFQLTDISLITEALLHMDYDDAFVAYLNGTEIARSAGLEGDFPSYNEVSSVNHEASMYLGGLPEAFHIPGHALAPLLIEGENVLAVQVHNVTLSSSDLSSNIFFSLGLSDEGSYYQSTPSWFEPPFSFSTSNLPIIIIDTEGQSIPNEPKITARMKIIHNEEGKKNSIYDEANEYDGFIGIEIRGASSAGYPQTPYALETRDSLGMNNNVPLLGMPRENDWVLLSHYNEKTFMRNPISFHLFREMGHYATRNRLCNVVINGNYEGIYLFGEKVKRDKFRVDVGEIFPHNNTGDSLTGGYIFKTEFYSSSNTWQSDYSPYYHPTYSTHFAYYYPKVDVISQAQKAYIKFAVDKFQKVMNQADFADHYAEYIDVRSFVDYFILSEVSRNVDGYKKSRYLYKERDSKGGKLYSGPAWDFDWAWKNIYDCPQFSATDGSGWSYTINDCRSNPSPGWMTRLLDDTTFANCVKCRYTELRETVLSDGEIDQFIDSVFSLVYEDQQVHFQRWEVLGRSTGAPEVESPANTYNEEVQKLRTWIDTRLAWLDINMPGSDEHCGSGVGLEQSIGRIDIYPNPASEFFVVEDDVLIQEIQIFSMEGVLKSSYTNLSSYSIRMDIDDLSSGLYIIRVKRIDGGIKSVKLLVE